MWSIHLIRDAPLENEDGCPWIASLWARNASAPMTRNASDQDPDIVSSEAVGVNRRVRALISVKLNKCRESTELPRIHRKAVLHCA